MEMEERTRRGVWKIERGIHNRASLGNTRPGQRNVGSNSMSKSVETLPKKDKNRVRGLDRP